MTTKGYYPGCSARGTSKEYEMSVKKVYEALGIELKEIDGWVCCGSSPAHVSSLLLADALALKNLSLSKEQGLKELVIPCMGCYSSFISAKHELENDCIRNKAEEATGLKYDDTARRIGIIHPLADLANRADEIKRRVKNKPTGLKAVCYYGCVFTRPPKVTGVEDFEDPKQMDSLLGAVGIEVLDWGSKTKCCGAAYSITRPDISLPLCERILSDALDAGADLIVVACPLCHGNLDMRQKQVEKKFGKMFGIPVVYMTQVLGIALGASPREVGLDKLFVDPIGVLKSKGLLR
ncbi:MAG: hypothetical protein MSIBF_00715 [Candidatus Altiarchaeales archaeon IMC4]|nr:MAG: hypothetical protein MSIBF_00715 [Candidatus Altiarchaeales archaeon IMC4]